MTLDAVERGNCDSCSCTVFQIQSNSKRCRGCGHGVIYHVAIVKETKAVGKVDWKAKIEEAKKSKDVSKTVFHAYRNFALWISFVLYGIYQISNGYEKPRFDRSGARDVYFYTASAFSIAVVYSYIAFINATSKEKQELGKVLMVVNAIPVATYLLQAFELSPSYMDLAGHPVDPARFLEWLSTCPILVYLIAEITDNTHRGDEVANYDYANLILGLICTVFRQPWSEFFACCAAMFFFHTMTALYQMFTTAIKGETNCKLDAASLFHARTITLVAWTAFPVTFFAQRTHSVSYETGEMMFCVADIFAKVFLTVILVNATIEESMNAKAKRMEGVANQISAQMAQADQLLEKLMPASVVQAMKAGKASGAEEYQSVTVFFSDITNFAQLAGKHSTKEMLGTLNNLWIQYDVVCKRWGMYKVETIGDAFLGVVGAPDRITDHAERAVNFAIDVIRMVGDFRTHDGEEIVTRIGLNSGPITAGVLGDSNPHWCIVGDAVNTASRMESTSKPMRIHVSESTYKLVANKGFKIEGPDVMNIKGKGQMSTYWVNGRA
ncbi:nucleotide cyclase [Chytriomyces sp. MP71]|nr:nucleotide cyclase [Chytriomyces sp. MP71]